MVINEIVKTDALKKNMWLLVMMFTITTFSGAIRKWVFSDSIISTLIFAVQLICPFLIYYFHKVKEQTFDEKNKKIADVLKLYGIVLIFEAFNPLNVTLFHGALGFILHFTFWLIILVYLQFRNWFPIERLFKLFLFASIFQFILGAFQYSLPAEHILNKYLVEGSVEEAGKAAVGDSIRVTGTFSFISGFGAYIIFYTFFICACMVKENFNRILLGFLITLGIYGCFISGSRGVTAFYIIGIFSFIIFSSDFLKSISLLFQIVVGVAFIILLNVGLNDPVNSIEKLDQAYSNFESRVEDNKEEGSSRGTEFIDVILGYNGPFPYFGAGLGGGYQGANELFGYSPYLKGIPPEGEVWKVIFEGGYLLLALKIFMFYRLLYNTYINKIFMLIIILLIFSTVPIVYNVYNLMYVALGICYLDKVIYLQKKKKLELE
ncbi:O-antigen ligase family protein [Pedobacter cryophilus]|uniref:O-antigen ligase domain-containing protein n=1 Tax=Pedobacter cryophilus TaxID=2571271 RepID=A0A4U1C0P8_9SPHI|nr:O-antigen ligase family protein [Pedobacter cryophilus]TKB98615.1 hypothetical protein FA046_05720 [Pedobacter cryophilus]